MTNGDKIRGFQDVEIAGFAVGIAKKSIEIVCKVTFPDYTVPDELVRQMYGEFLKFLKQEADSE